MKVLLVDNTNAFGGAFELALTLTAALARTTQVEPVLVSAQPPEELKRRVAPPVRFHHLRRAPRLPQLGGPRIVRWPLSAAAVLVRELPAALKLAAIARRERARLIHLNNLLNDQPYGVLAAKLAGVPCICSHRDYEYDSPYVRLIEKWVAHHIACSSPIHDNLSSLGIRSSKIARLWDGVDTSSFAPGPGADLQTLFGVPPGKKIVAIFGRLVDWKGHEIFLKAAQTWLSAVPDSHALIVGGVSDGDPLHEVKLRKLTRALGIDARTTYAGYQRNIRELMCASTVLVHASLKPEPFGTVVLEGMSCARAWVAMNEGGPAEMIEDGKSGLLVPPNDAAAMAAAVISFLTNDDVAKGMGAAARRRAVEHFSAERFAAAHLALYQRHAR